MSDNETLVRACVRHASSGDYAALDDILAEDFVLHPFGAEGAAGLAEMVEGFRRGLGGLTATVEHQFSSGDYVASRWRLSGRHDGELLGVPATGRQVDVPAITISRCRDGRIAEEWELIDLAAMLRQIGALPEPAAA